MAVPPSVVPDERDGRDGTAAPALPPAPAPAGATSPVGRPGGGRSWARIPPVIWAVTLLHTLLLLGYTVLYPPYLNPDEAQHVDLVLAVQDEQLVWAPGERRASEAILSTFAEASSDLVPFAEDGFGPRDERASYRELGSDRPGPQTELPNQLVQHPPLYYASAAALLEILPNSDIYRWDATLGVLRLLSVLLIAPLPLLVYLAGRRLAPDRPRVAVVAAAGVLLVPGITRSGGSVNNDNLVVLLSAVLLVVVAGLLRPDGPERGVAWRRGLTIGVLAGLVALTKGNGLLMFVMLALAYPVASVARRRLLWAEVLIVGVVSFAVGGWWWVRNLVLYGTLQPSGLGAEALAIVRGPERAPDMERSAVEFVTNASWKLIQLFVATPGLFTPPRINPALVTTLAVVAAVGVVLALTFRSSLGRARAACLVVPIVVLYAYLLLGSWDWYQHNLSYPGLQGRYLYFLAPGLLITIAAGWDVVTPRQLRRLVLPVVCAAGVAFHAWTTWRVFSYYWESNYGPPWTLGGIERGAWVLTYYAPWPTDVTVAVPAGVVVATMALLVAALRHRDEVPEATARRAGAGAPVS